MRGHPRLIETIIQARGSDRPLFTDIPRGQIIEGELDTFVILECATMQGKDAVLLKFTLDNGMTALVQVTAEEFKALAAKLG